MLRTTRANLGKPMAVVFIEQRREEVDVGGQKVQRDIKEEKVINPGDHPGHLLQQFPDHRTRQRARPRELALLLRAGALAAPIFVIEERVVGPGLGKENIEKGVNARMLGMVLLFVFMAVVLQGLRHGGQRWCCSPTWCCSRRC
jgi:preprotein translocase subunit SecD